MTSRRKLCQSSQAALLTAATLVAILAVGCQSAENAAPPASPQAASPAPTATPNAAGPEAQAPGAAAISVSKLLDETRLPDLQGATKSLRDRMGPKGLLVVFVDTHCTFSATAINEISSVSSVLAKHEVSSALLNVGEPQATVEQFYAQRQMGMPVIYDTGKAALAAWGVTFTPTAILVDPSGAAIYRGTAVWADVGAAAEKALGLAPGTLKFTVKGTGFV